MPERQDLYDPGAIIVQVRKAFRQLIFLQLVPKAWKNAAKSVPVPARTPALGACDYGQSLRNGAAQHILGWSVGED